jgi:tol-pal system protein YbgF
VKRTHYAIRLAGALMIAGSTMLAPQLAGAQLFGDNEARRAIIDMRGKVEALSRALEERTTELAERIDRLEQTARGQLDLQNQIEALRQDVAKLRGQLEVQGNELSQNQRRQKDLYSDLDTRLKPFEPTKIEIDGKVVLVEPEEQKTFDAAMTRFRAGDFGAAVSDFGHLRKRWPNSGYMPEALFWMGSAQFALKDLKASIATQHALISTYPEDKRVPDAMLGIGIAQLDSGDKKAARKTLSDLIARHKDSAAAKIARERLAALK